MDLTSALNVNTEPEARAAGGYFCDIYRGQLRDGTAVAIKAVKPYDYQTNDHWRKRMRDVLGIWTECRHPNVVQIIGEAHFQGCLTAVYVWHEYKSVREYLDQHPTADRWHLSAQICEGVAYLHASNIVHGSLSGSQVLVLRNGLPRIILSVETTTTVTDTFGSVVQTRWTAPELIHPGSKNTTASDIYALGMTILETVTRSLPYSEMIVENGEYEEEDILELLSSGLLPQRPEDSIPQTDAGEVIWDVLCKCWSPDPAYRPSAVDVSQIMHSVHQTPDGVTLGSPRPVVGEDTDLASL